MATRSRIGILNEDKMTVESIYCHWDGYLTNNGKLLNEHWKDLESVKELIRLGDLSCLGTTIQDSVFYGRDRHDIDVESKHHSLIRWVDSGHDYEYLYTPSLGTWSYRDAGADIRGPWVLLSEALNKSNFLISD
jgi:hypothetical protein